MARARRSGVSLALLLVLLGAAAAAVPPAVPSKGDGRPAAVVGWPVSTLVLSELMTGGAGASDEFVEIANAGDAAVDLAGLEVVYVTSSGSTVTRKATWATTRPLAPGQHLLLANTAGAYASTADSTYTGGLAATGGAVALRVVGGSVVDAVGWGDATNAFVEGAPALAPAAGSSLERRPGGAAGSGTDSNDNASDWVVRGTPDPQRLADPLVPGASPTLQPSPSPSSSASPSPSSSPSAATTPGQSPSPSATPPPVTPSPSGTPTATPAPTAPPSDTPTPTPDEPPASPPTSPVPGPSASAVPLPSQDASPDPTTTPAPSGSGSAFPSVPPSASPTPDAVITPIAVARAIPDGSEVTVEGILTTDLGALESGRAGFVQDGSGGIGIYLDDPVVGGPPAGTVVRITGITDSRYAQRTLRVGGAGLTVLGFADLPGAVASPTGAIGEGVEGLRVVVGGTVTEPPSALADGTGLTVDDGSGPVRVVVTPAALSLATVATGSTVVAIGPVGQRDSSGTGAAGYRVQATRAGDLTLIVAPPSPSPTPTETPTATPGESPSLTPTPSPTLLPSPSPIDSAPPASPGATPAPSPSPSGSEPLSPSPSASPSPAPDPSGAITIDVVDARSQPIGALVRVRGTVTAEAGRLGTPALIAIQDGSAGIMVRLPAGSIAPPRGSAIEVAGALAAPYGQLEVRPHPGDVSVFGVGTPPTPLAVLSMELGESVEADLVAIEVTVDRAPQREANGSLTLDALDPATGGRVAIRVDGSAGIVATDLPRGSRARLIGVAGQRATRSGRLDGYRIWLRDRADIGLIAPPSPSPGGSGGPSASPGAMPVTSIAQALIAPGGPVRVEGTVTVAGPLLDSDGRTLVIQDASAAIAVRLPSGAAAPRAGDRVRVDGRVGRAYGAPRLAATAATIVGPASPVLPAVLHALPGAAFEWRLVRISGTVVDIHREGDRWRAEVADGRAHLLVVGLPASGIASSALVEGRAVIVIGIVRRPYPTASDLRFAVEPRSVADVRLGAPVRGGPIGGGSPGGAGSSTGGGDQAGTGGGPPAPGDPQPIDVDIATLGDHVGATVRVGGIVTAVVEGAILLDDGTAVGRIALAGDSASYLDLLAPGDALDAIGRVEGTADGLAVHVVDAAGIVRVGDPGTSGADPTTGAPAGGANPGTDLVGAAAGEADGVEPGAAADAPDGGGPLGLVLLVTLALAGAGALGAGVAVRQRRAQARALSARLAERLSALARPTVAPGAGTPGGTS